MSAIVPPTIRGRKRESACSTRDAVILNPMVEFVFGRFSKKVSLRMRRIRKSRGDSVDFITRGSLSVAF